MESKDPVESAERPASPGWSVRPHGSVGPRRRHLVDFSSLASQASPAAAPGMTLVLPLPAYLGGSSSPASLTRGWSVRTPAKAPSPPPPPPIPVEQPLATTPSRLHPPAIAVAAGGVLLVGLISNRLATSTPAPGGAPRAVPVATAPARPLARPVPNPLANATLTAYRVQLGDTLSAIAQRHGLGLGALAAANPQIHDLNLIVTGELIRIP